MTTTPTRRPDGMIEHGPLGTRVHGLDPANRTLTETLSKLGFRPAKAGYFYLPPDVGQTRRTLRVQQLCRAAAHLGVAFAIRPHPGTALQVPTAAPADSVTNNSRPLPTVPRIGRSTHG